MSATGPAVVPGQWTHLAGTYAGTTKTFYVNGLPVASAIVQFVAGRNSGNPFMQSVPHWEPSRKLEAGPAVTYKWIHQQYHPRKMGKRIIQ